MNKPLALISILAVSLPLLSCTNDPGATRDTVFYPADESPRTGMTQRQQRFGYRGSSNENPNTRSSSDNGNSRNQPPADPDGIIKPRDLDADPNSPEDLTPTGGTGDPTTGAGVGETTTAEPTSEIPYAEAVPGRYGLVYSPFVTDKKKALVNVTDENNVTLPPGTEVQCPLTGKIFRVP